MGLPSVLDYAHLLMIEHIKAGDVVVDATCGNGNDTLFLAKLVGDNGKVYGFDIQEKAIANTSKKLQETSLMSRVECIVDSHEQIGFYVTKEVSAAMFNLGYLPGADKEISTKPDTTIKAISSLLQLLKVNGLITIVIYTGHDQFFEGNRLEEYLQTLDQKNFSVIKYNFINQINHPPYLLVIEKIK